MKFRPTYELTIESQLMSNSANNRVVALSVSSSLTIPVNECLVTIPRLEGMNLEKEMKVTLKLGYDGDYRKVFTGELKEVTFGIDTIKLTVLSSFQELVNDRSNAFFENPTAGDMVLDICRQKGITPGKVDTGLNFSFYTLGTNRSTYDHIKELADHCGFDLYADENDQLIFGKAIPGTTHNFQLGVNVLELDVKEADSQISKVEIYGESPASIGQGPQSASWLTKKEVKGSFGTGNGVTKRAVIPTIRTLDNASRVAQALHQKWQVGKIGTLKTMGAPKIKIGDTIMVDPGSGNPAGGVFKVMGFQHQLDVRKGFISQFQIQEL